MAFMGMFLAFMVVVLVILGISAFMVFACFLSSGLVMVVKKRKNRGSGVKVKTPWYVIALRVVGGISALPLVATVVFIINAIIANEVDKSTNLPRAVMSCDYATAEQILKNGADPDVKDKYGRTLLMCVISHEEYVSTEDSNRYEFLGDNYYDDKDDIKMMELLIEYGADVNAAVTSCGDEGNHVYTEGGWHDIYANSDHFCGNTPLIYAIKDHRSARVVKFLLENGADVNTANLCGFTPILMCADERSDDDGGYEIAQMLLNEGADTHAETNFHQDIGWLLMRRGTDDIDQMSTIIQYAY